MKMAFTQAFLDEEIFMHEPEGYGRRESTPCTKHRLCVEKTHKGQRARRTNRSQENNSWVIIDSFERFVWGRKWIFWEGTPDNFVLFNEAGKELRDKLIHLKEVKQGIATSYNDIYQIILDVNINRMVNTVKFFINFYEPNLIINYTSR